MAPQVGCRGAAAGGQNSLYLFVVRVSHHALQVVKDGVPLHGRQGLPGHVAGGLVLTLHLGGCRRREGAKVRSRVGRRLNLKDSGLRFFISILVPTPFSILTL